MSGYYGSETAEIFGRRERGHKGCKACYEPCLVMAGDPAPRCSCPEKLCNYPIYFRGTQAVPLSLLTTPVNLSTATVESISPAISLWNPITGVFTIPQGGSGFYTLQAAVTVQGASEATAATTTISILKNGATVLTQAVGQVGPSPALQTISVGTGWLLAQYETVSIQVVSSVAGVTVQAGPGTNFSVVRVSYP